MLCWELLLFSGVQCEWQFLFVSLWLKSQIIWNFYLLSCLFFLYQRYAFNGFVSWLIYCRTNSVLFLFRLLETLLVKVFTKNKHTWGVFLCWNQDLNTRCGKWLQKKHVELKRWFSFQWLALLYYCNFDFWEKKKGKRNALLKHDLV